MKKFTMMIAVLILVSILSACDKLTYEDGYEAGYEKGRIEGYQTGYGEGYDFGRNGGYDTGYYDGYCAAGGELYEAYISRWNGDNPTLP